MRREHLERLGLVCADYGGKSETEGITRLLNYPMLTGLLSVSPVDPLRALYRPPRF